MHDLWLASLLVVLVGGASVDVKGLSDAESVYNHIILSIKVGLILWQRVYEKHVCAICE